MAPIFKTTLGKLHQGDCREVLKACPDNHFTTVITDPPYELKSKGGSGGFMGKKWDGTGIAFQVETWREVKRVTKPGGMLLAFGGTRTHHRLMVAIEDAGWEIRDCMMMLWCYGSGFPKSYNISKGLDKMAGVEREVVGSKLGQPGYSLKENDTEIHNRGDYSKYTNAKVECDITAPATPEAQLWDGYGTALKPAYEIIIKAQKSLDLQGYCGIMAQKIWRSLCQLRSFVKTAEPDSLLNRAGSNVVNPDSAAWIAVEKSSTPVDLLGQMGTLLSLSEIPTSLSIGLSWLITLAELCSRMSKFTTEMKTVLTTDLKTLNSLPSGITPDCIIQAATGQSGIGSNAALVGSIFNVVALKLGTIPGVSAQGSATSKDQVDSQDDLVPAYEPIIVAMKPLDGTFANNALVHGVAGLNIDTSRISTDENLNGGAYGDNLRQRKEYNSTDTSPDAVSLSRLNRGTSEYQQPKGRWPANLLMSHHPECEQVGVKKVQNKSGNVTGKEPSTPAKNTYSKYDRKEWVKHGDPDGTETVEAWNCHPDCPISIMDKQSGVLTSGAMKKSYTYTNTGTSMGKPTGKTKQIHESNTGGASRFFYCAKASRAERGAANKHPTVKPLKLITYLVNLTAPPENPRILDPFIGSGTLGIVCETLGIKYVGIDLDCSIAKDRISNTVSE